VNEVLREMLDVLWRVVRRSARSEHPVSELTGCLDEPDDKLCKDDQLAEFLPEDGVVLMDAGIKSCGCEAMLIADLGDGDVADKECAVKGTC
jgi:hypothetical protein